MTDPSHRRGSDARRDARLSQALRDNLKRRKSQLRGRADQAATLPDPAAPAPASAAGGRDDATTERSASRDV